MKALKCENAAALCEMSLIGMQAGGYVRRFYKEKGYKRKKKVLGNLFASLLCLENTVGFRSFVFLFLFKHLDCN